jgi:hypothetical protein
MTPDDLLPYAEDSEAFEETPDGSITPTPPAPVPFQMWGALCFDLVLDPQDTAGVCRSHSITEQQLLILLENKAFIDKLKDAKLQVKTLGSSAGFVLTARAEAEKHVVTMSRLASDTGINAGVRVRAMENIVRYAHLDPATSSKGKEGQDSNRSGVLVQFNIGGGILGERKTLTIEAAPQPQGETE